MVKALVRHGCNVRIDNWLSQKARDVAEEAGYQKVAEFLDSCKRRVVGRDLKPQEITLAEDVKPPGEFRKDWMCPACGAKVFGNKKHCFKCQTPKPPGLGEDEVDGVSPLGKHLLYEMRILQGR